MIWSDDKLHPSDNSNLLDIDLRWNHYSIPTMKAKLEYDTQGGII